MKIHYTGQCGEGWGWGTFGTHMVREFKRLGNYTDDPNEADALFHVLTNPDFNPLSPLRGKINVGLTFFESELGPNAAENAKKYDVVFCGSTWCLERMKAHGIQNGEVLIQGVDTSVFKPGERKKDGQFRIFSGGKFEYRKGQDLVIAAFREFAKTHPEAHLVCSWFNPWPSLINSMRWTNVLRWPDAGHLPHREKQETFFKWLMTSAGLTEEQFTILPQLSHADLAREMENTDCGLFPNRCEGGTNLVMMEYAACGGHVIANRMTGHRDVEHLVDSPLADTSTQSGWAEDSVENIVTWLKVAKIHAQVNLPRKDKQIPSWESAAKQVLQRVELLLNREGESV